MLRKKILILGAAGMLGNNIYRYLLGCSDTSAYGSIRSKDHILLFNNNQRNNLIVIPDCMDLYSIEKALNTINPDVLINCVGIIKQLEQSLSVIDCVPVNTLFPHQLSKICDKHSVRFIHFSTDCVFTGRKGNYLTSDTPDAIDLYGLSKKLGEPQGSRDLVIRTSIIGRELTKNVSLLNWFLSQNNEVRGYIKAYFSGLPATEIAKVIHEYILPNDKLSGLYHLSSSKISKFELLNIISEVYESNIKIIPFKGIKIDRSLNGIDFYNAAGYRSPDWVQMIEEMKRFN